jgi:hypothetical protein
MDMKRKPVYKVVGLDNISIFTHTNSYSLTYKIGKVVEAIPNSYGIFCFDSMRNVRRFMEYYNVLDYRILKCRPIGRKTKVTFIATSGNVSPRFYRIKHTTTKKEWKLYEKNFRDFYHISNGKNTIRVKEPPEGTVCFKSVEILEEVYPEVV